MTALAEEAPLQQEPSPQMPIPMNGQGSTATSTAGDNTEEVQEQHAELDSPTVQESTPVPRDTDNESNATAETGDTWEQPADPMSAQIVMHMVQQIEQGGSPENSTNVDPLGPYDGDLSNYTNEAAIR